MELHYPTNHEVKMKNNLSLTERLFNAEQRLLRSKRSEESAIESCRSLRKTVEEQDQELLKFYEANTEKNMGEKVT